MIDKFLPACRRLLACVLLALGTMSAGISAVQAQDNIDAVCVDTNLGEFCLEMLEQYAPQTVARFLSYVRDGDYNNTVIHRSLPASVIQGGGFKAEPLGSQVPVDAYIPNEFAVSNLRGTVAMAQSWGPNSATNQWFVNVADNLHLNMAPGAFNITNPTGYFTVFARVVSGMAVVDAINALERGNLAEQLGGAFTDVPLTGTTNDSVSPQDLVVVHRIYETQVAPPPPGPVATLVNKRFSAPFTTGDGIPLRGTFLLIDENNFVFELDLDGVVQLTNPPEEMASYDHSTGILLLPNAQVGDQLYYNVRFRSQWLVDEDGMGHLQFVLLDYDLP